MNGIHHNEMEDKKLVEYAALAESASSHPISKSLQRAYGKEPYRTRVSDIQGISGNGVIAKVDGLEVAAIEAADIVLMDDDPMKISKAIPENA